MNAAQGQNPGVHLLSAMVASGMWLAGAAWDAAIFTWLGGILSALLALMALRAAIAGLARWRRLRRFLQGPGAFGAGDFMDFAAIAAAGHTALAPTYGLFVGARDGLLLFFNVETHALTVAPAGGGKTSGIVLPNILHAAALAASGNARRGMVITDKDGEVAAMCWDFVEKRLPKSACLNPYHLHDLPNHRLNPLEDLIALARAASPEIVDAARRKMLIIVIEPERGGDAKFFRDLARDLGAWLCVFFAIDRQDRCTLPDLFDAVNGGDVALIALFAEMQKSDAAGGQVARAGARYLSLLQNADRTFAGVISELQGALSLWDSYAVLGRSVRHSDVELAMLKDGPAIVFLVMPEDKVASAARHIALLIDMAVQAVMKHPSKKPEVVFLLDEFQRLPVMPSIPAALFRGRGSGLILWPIIQDLRGLVPYGKDESAFRTQADLIQMFGVRDVADAAYLETRIGQHTLRTQSASMADGPSGAPSFTHAQQGAPRLRKDEILQTPGGQQYIIFREHPVIRAEIVPWWLIDPWRGWPAANPKEGAAPSLPPAFTLRYGTSRDGVAGARQDGARSPRRPRAGWIASAVSALGLVAGWLWAPALLLVSVLYFGLPSLRITYSYIETGPSRFYMACFYAGLDGPRFLKAPGDCPLVRMAPLRLPSAPIGGGR